MQQTTPILSYAADASPENGLQRRDHGDGRFELFVPSPSLWRVVAGPSITLAVLTALLGFAVLWMAMSFTESMMYGGVSLLVVLAGGAAWLGTLLQIVRIARSRRSPFSLMIDATGFRLSGPAWSAAAHDSNHLHRGIVRYVRFFPLQHGLFHGTTRLLIKLDDAPVIAADIPTRFGQRFQPIEAWLQTVLTTRPAGLAPAECQCAS